MTTLPPLADAPRGESGFSQAVLAALDSHFHVETEIRGSHPLGKRLRIDAILRPRDVSSWSRSDIALGVEFKTRTDQRRIRKDSAKIICQCIDYSLTKWDGYGIVPIFFCPGFAESQSLRERELLFGPGNYKEGFKHGIGYIMQAVLGQSNVGELVHSQHLGWAFLMNGQHRIWSQKYGIGTGKRDLLLKRVGSR